KGVNSRKEINTATLTGLANPLTASATVTVNCSLAPLEVSKTAEASYTNTIGWDLSKVVDEDSHSGTAGTQAGYSYYYLSVSRTDTPSDYQVIGDITITNPSAVDVPFIVTDMLNDGDSPATATQGEVTCPATVVPAGGTIVCTYVAIPDDATA